MPDMSDNELDRLFQEAAEGIKPDFDPEDWARLEQQLEYIDRGASARGISLWSMAGLLLLMSGWSEFNQIIVSSLGNVETQKVSFHVEQRKNQHNVNERQTKATDKNTPSLNNQTTKANLTESDSAANDVNEGVDNNKIPTTSVIQSKQVSDYKQSKTLSPVKNDLRTSNNSQPFNTGDDHERKNIKSDKPDNATFLKHEAEIITDHKNTSPPSTPILLQEELHNNDSKTKLNDNSIQPSNDEVNIQPNSALNKNAVTTRLTNDNKKFATISDEEILPANGTSTVNNKTNSLTKNAIIRDHVTSDLSKTDSIRISDSIQIATPQAIKEDTTTNKKAEHYKSSWFVKLPISPDFTSINYGRTDKSGINIGLLVEFQVSKHLGVTTGAIWSRKIYTTDNPAMTYGGWGKAITINSLQGDCRVLDIPLNVTYYLHSSTHTSFFITSGMSSYIMLKEKYEYDVTGKTSEYLYYENYNHKNTEWLSMLNLSIGIQRQLSKKFSLQAEPFMKAPLKGVGQGKVNLVSMGAFITIKYKLK
jgi:hypothetical protein